MSEQPGHPPRCISIIICEQVIEDVRTRNKSLIGCFNGIEVQSLPALHPKMYVVVALTGGRGINQIRLRITSASGTQFEATGEVQFEGPMGVTELVFELLGLPLREPGEYEVAVHCGHPMLASRTFSVVAPSHGR